MVVSLAGPVMLYTLLINLEIKAEKFHEQTQRSSIYCYSTLECKNN